MNFNRAGGRSSRSVAEADAVNPGEVLSSPFGLGPAPAVRGVAAAPMPMRFAMGADGSGQFSFRAERAAPLVAEEGEDVPPPPVPAFFNLARHSSFALAGAAAAGAVGAGLTNARAALKREGVRCEVARGLPTLSLLPLSGKEGGIAPPAARHAWTVTGRAGSAEASAWVQVFSKGDGSLVVNVARGGGDASLFFQIYRALETHTLCSAEGRVAIPAARAAVGKSLFGARPSLA